MSNGEKPTCNLLQLKVLGYRLSVCKCAEVPADLLAGGFCCIARTDDEISLVCETARVPEGAISREDGWRAFKVEGPLDFSLVGILAKLASALAAAKVPLFAISTFDTDYILVKGERLERAIAAFVDEGCLVDDSDA